MVSIVTAPKRIVLMAVLTLAVSSCSICTGGWTHKDTLLEAASLGLTVGDWRETVQIASDPVNYVERNPILGVHPSVAAVNGYFLLVAVAHPVLACALPPKARHVMQYWTIGVEALANINNMELGLSPTQ